MRGVMAEFRKIVDGGAKCKFEDISAMLLKYGMGQTTDAFLARNYSPKQAAKLRDIYLAFFKTLLSKGNTSSLRMRLSGCGKSRRNVTE
jgi:hypothetical protein